MQRKNSVRVYLWWGTARPRGRRRPRTRRRTRRDCRSRRPPRSTGTRGHWPLSSRSQPPAVCPRRQRAPTAARSTGWPPPGTGTPARRPRWSGRPSRRRRRRPAPETTRSFRGPTGERRATPTGLRTTGNAARPRPPRGSGPASSAWRPPAGPSPTSTPATRTSTGCRRRHRTPATASRRRPPSRPRRRRPGRRRARRRGRFRPRRPRDTTGPSVRPSGSGRSWTHATPIRPENHGSNRPASRCSAFENERLAGVLSENTVLDLGGGRGVGERLG